MQCLVSGVLTRVRAHLKLVFLWLLSLQTSISNGLFGFGVGRLLKDALVCTACGVTFLKLVYSLIYYLTISHMYTPALSMARLLSSPLDNSWHPSSIAFSPFSFHIETWGTACWILTDLGGWSCDGHCNCNEFTSTTAMYVILKLGLHGTPTISSSYSPPHLFSGVSRALWGREASRDVTLRDKNSIVTNSQHIYDISWTLFQSMVLCLLTKWSDSVLENPYSYKWIRYGRCLGLCPVFSAVWWGQLQALHGGVYNVKTYERSQ